MHDISAANRSKAKDILEILRMWEVTKQDALDIASSMSMQIAAVKDGDWTNPLAGTGITIPGAPNWPGRGPGGNA